LVSRPSSTELVRLARDEVLARRGEIAAVWTWVSDDRVDDILPRHAGRDAFTFLAAVDPAGHIVGFAYGYRGGPGQWWHDAVRAAMTPAQRRDWLRPGHVELAELHVAPAWRRQGLGGRLHDELLASFPDAPTSLLSTQTGNAPALALYEARGWRTVVPELRFAASAEPYAILGLDLAGTRRRRGGAAATAE
jgi:ribosomal protein S18 acetylase RimI-like enzyme